MSDFAERPRTKKKSKGKKKKPASGGNVAGTLAAIVVLGGIVAGAIALGQYLSRPPELQPIARSPWPPPAEMPREQLFGDHPGEAVVPYESSNYGFPLRRRFCDPWIRLSNVRSDPPKSSEREVKFDLEVVTPAPPGIRAQLHIELPPQAGEGNLAMPFSFHLYRIGGLEEALRRGRGTVTLQIPTDRPGKDGPLTLEGMEIYMLTIISSGSFPRQPQFKVSPSVFFGGGGRLHSPREWTEEEVGLITGRTKNTPSPRQVP